MSVLERIVETKRAEVESLAARRADLRARAAALAPARPFEAALRPATGEVALVAEIKRRSPSAGAIRPDLTVPDVARAYAGAGAAAASPPAG